MSFIRQASLSALTSLTHQAPFPSSNPSQAKTKSWQSCRNCRAHPTYASGMMANRALHPVPSAVYPLILRLFCMSNELIVSGFYTYKTYPFDFVIYQVHRHHHVLACDTTASSIQYQQSCYGSRCQWCKLGRLVAQPKLYGIRDELAWSISRHTLLSSSAQTKGM